MKKLINSLGMILLLAMVLLLNADVKAMASSGSGTVYVRENCIMSRAVAGATRSTQNSYVLVSADSVYPVSGQDTYKKCRTRLYHPAIGNTPISDEYVLTEGTGYTKIVIKEGYLGWNKFDLYFAGNNPVLPAYVAYSYNGK